MGSKGGGGRPDHVSPKIEQSFHVHSSSLSFTTFYVTATNYGKSRLTVAAA